MTDVAQPRHYRSLRTTQRFIVMIEKQDRGIRQALLIACARPHRWGRCIPLGILRRRNEQTGARHNSGPRDNSRSRNGNSPTHDRAVGADASAPHNSSSANDSMSGCGLSQPTKCQHDGQCGLFHLESPNLAHPTRYKLARKKAGQHIDSPRTAVGN